MTLKSEPGSEFGQNLRLRRQARGLGLTSLAEQVGVDPSFMAALELDPDPSPTLKTVFALCDILGCTIHDLVPSTAVIVAVRDE